MNILFSADIVGWWAQVESNHRPHAYQACALTFWAMSPYCLAQPRSTFDLQSNSYEPRFRFCNRWWRWRESNPWPPACRAGALPAELHPHNGIFPTVPGNRTTTECANRVYVGCFVSLWVTKDHISIFLVLHRKEVIQPHLPIRLPCYDLTPITEPTFGSCPLAVSSLTSGVSDFHGLTGGVYKARERIHRGMLIRDY